MPPPSDLSREPRRPADDWPAWVLVVVWVLWRGVTGPVDWGRSLGRRLYPGARRTGRTLAARVSAMAAELPGTLRRTSARCRTAGSAARNWLTPFLVTAVIAGVQLDRGAAGAARRTAVILVERSRVHVRSLRQLMADRAPAVAEATARWWRGGILGVAALAHVARARSNRRPTGRSLRLGHALRRSALATVVLAASFWTLSAPALRLGAEVFADRVEQDGLPTLEESSVVAGSNGELLTAMPGGPDRTRVGLEDIPDVVEEMVVAVEDERFWDHSGWDGAGTVRAALANIDAGRVEQGGSTISQQLAKQNFAGSDRTVIRKAKELLYAVALEERYSKEELLEYYLNQVYLGSGAYGVAAAAQEYFGVDVGDLSPAQAALLVGLIRSPGSLDPRTHPDAARDRRNVVLGIAAERGIVTESEAEAERATPPELTPSPTRVTDPLLAAAVRRELLVEPALGSSREQRAERLATGGLRIETSVDAHLQAAARAAVEQGLEAWPDLGGALAAVDPHTGMVRAMASTTPAGTASFDVATQGRRQPGSTFKPLAAIAALEAGLDPRQRMEGDGPAIFEHQPGQRWTVENYDEADHGSVTLGEAVTSSVNTAFAQLAVGIGTDRIVDVARRLGIDVEESLGGPDERGPSIALGAHARGVSPLELASAYGIFATGGTYLEPRIVTRVIGPDGRVLLDRRRTAEPVVDDAVVATVREMLQVSVDRGTGRAAQLEGWEPAGKTGTSQNNADAWFVGALPTLSVATWLGHPDAAQPVPDLTGGGAAAPMWHAFATVALDGTAPVPFPEPSGELPTSTSTVALPDPLDDDDEAQD